MIRFLLRLCGFVLVAAAFATLVVDGTRSIAAGHLLQYGLGNIAAWLGGARYASALRSLAEAPSPVRQVAAGLLVAPGWAVMGGLGLVLLHAGRPRVGTIGISRRRA